MSMFESFLGKGFKAAKCKTLLKLALPRIKLLRNRREIQIKQMRHDIAKLLESGQEATARIRVEHVIREQNMVAAQEILELFCELISVRLSVIEAQRECPPDLKEAISSICFAAPRCGDLPELLEVQMLFASKYGKEFVMAATELMPDCGVNRQVIELLSIRPPSPEAKMKFLKEIAEEHEIEWDSVTSESEFLKTHEDLLNGPIALSGQSKLPNAEQLESTSIGHSPPNLAGPSVSVSALNVPDLPDVPTRAPEANPMVPSAPVSDPKNVPSSHPLYPSSTYGSQLRPDVSNHEPKICFEDAQACGAYDAKEWHTPDKLVGPSVYQQTLNYPSDTRKLEKVAASDLQDVLAAAQAAAETAERAATAARSAANLAQARINELTKRKDEFFSDENPFGTERHEDPVDERDAPGSQGPSLPSEVHDPGAVDPSSPDTKFEGDPSFDAPKEVPLHYHPRRRTSIDDDSYLSYPNLFGAQS